MKTRLHLGRLSRRSHFGSRLALSGLGLLLLGLATMGLAQTVKPDLYAGLKWRNIGPFRAGRVSAVAGVVGQPGVFYIGLPLGGVWKTTSAGETWYPIFDDVKEVSCIGAIEVAPSDPNIIYVGTGDLITGGGINEGNGMYKSTDAGRTWQHIGLDDTRQIPSILVDPHDPNVVLVAAQATSTPTPRSAVFFVAPTAARRGRRRCTWTTKPESRALPGLSTARTSSWLRRCGIIPLRRPALAGVRHQQRREAAVARPRRVQPAPPYTNQPMKA